jgi:prephenate dehydratase
MIIGYLGPEGTFTEKALELFRPDATRVALPNLEAVFQAAHSGAVNLGFVPVENRHAGLVTETYDLLFEYADRLQIIDATILPIQHALGALPNRSEIRTILSKDNALDQCSKYLNATYPNAEKRSVASTTGAMQMISEGGLQDAAAIGREDSFAEYGLQVIASNIADIKDNKTRFIVLGPGSYQSEPTGKDVTSIVVYPHRDRVGLLEDILDVISSKYSLNMSSLQSRPDERGGYRFYIDLEGHISDPRMLDCIKGIDQRLKETDVVVLGSYPLKRFVEPRIKTIGIIGGTGKMGSGFFKPYLEGLGYQVLISGRKTSLTYEECVKQSDAVIVNVPIEETVSIIQQIGQYFRKGQLIVDNAGVKTNGIIDAMLEFTAQDVEVLSVHTMFAEKITSLSGRRVVSIHTERSGELAREFEDIFYKYGAEIVRVTANEHDSKAAPNQSGLHILFAAYTRAIIDTFGHPHELGSFFTPNSELAMVLSGRIHSGDADLLATMAEQNPHALEFAELVYRRLGEMLEPLKRGDATVLRQYLLENQEALGSEFITDSVRQSEAMHKSRRKKK